MNTPAALLPPDEFRDREWHWLKHEKVIRPWYWWNSTGNPGGLVYWVRGKRDTVMPAEMAADGWTYHAPAAPNAHAEISTLRTDALTHAEALAGKDREIAVLAAGIRDVSALIDESSGVGGLHLNGDFASWNELLEGGRFEEWLIAFSHARAAITAHRAETQGEK